MSFAEVAVPEALRRPYHLVAATREAFRGVNPDETGCLRIRSGPGVASIYVSRDHLRGALLIFHVLGSRPVRRRDWLMYS